MSLYDHLCSSVGVYSHVLSPRSSSIDPETSSTSTISSGVVLLPLVTSLVKIFALAGIRVGELPQVTVERVRAGRLPVRTGRERRYVPLPACLQGELLDFARRLGLTAGPVFCTRNGKGMSRTQVTEEIQTLCHDARVEEEKGTPRCLRKLYLATRAEVERGVRLLAEQSYERMLDTEQLAAGWAEGTGHSIHKDVYI